MPLARAIDRGLGLGTIGCSLLAVADGHAASLPGLVTSALLAVAGVSFLRRTPAPGHPPIGTIVPCVASIASSALVLHGAPLPETWPLGATALFVAGGLLAMLSLGALGPSFAVLPARRALVERGPYRWLRHPAYAGELTMMIAAVLAAGSVHAVVALGLALLLLLVRIHFEESSLGRDAGYHAYAARVRWRLLPGVW